MGDRKFVISKAMDEEILDAVKQLIALEDHLTTDAVRTNDLQYQKQKDEVRAIRKAMMRRLLHAPETPPDIEIRKRLASADCILKHLCLSYVILTEICDLLSRAGDNEDIVMLLGYAKKLNSMLHDYIAKAQNILQEAK